MKTIKPTKYNVVKYTELPSEIRDDIHIYSNDTYQKLYLNVEPDIYKIEEFYKECKKDGEMFAEFVMDSEVKLSWWFANNYKFEDTNLPILLEICW